MEVPNDIFNITISYNEARVFWVDKDFFYRIEVVIFINKDNFISRYHTVSDPELIQVKGIGQNLFINFFFFIYIGIDIVFKIQFGNVISVIGLNFAENDPYDQIGYFSKGPTGYQ